MTIALPERELQFYADELPYNGRRVTRADWQEQAIEASFDAMRLQDSGTTNKAFLGFMPSRKPVKFGEHVFYHFRDSDGLADEVWSMPDVQAVNGRSPGR